MTALLAAPPLPALHPNMAAMFHGKVMTLAAALEHDEHRDAARQALRGFLEKIIIPADDGLLQVVGNFGEMLTAAQVGIDPVTRRSVMLVAGAGFEPATFGL